MTYVMLSPLGYVPLGPRILFSGHSMKTLRASHVSEKSCFEFPPGGFSSDSFTVQFRSLSRHRNHGLRLTLYA